MQSGHYVAVPLDIAVPSDGVLNTLDGTDSIVGVIVLVLFIVSLLAVFSFLLYRTYKGQIRKDTMDSVEPVVSNGDD